jgi:S-DNA-T family DNA segregation ATPase FtsK/SpoIIIE
VDGLLWAWREACHGAGIGREVGTVTGPTLSVPRVVDVTLGPPTVLMVELLPGQLLGDVAAAAHRLAPALGARALRLEPRGLRHVRVELLVSDPLDVAVSLPQRPALAGPVLLARDEQGRDLLAEPAALPHLAVQGQTRSGKSAWTYSLLAQVSHRPDVLVAGVDPTGLLLRPYVGSRHADWQCVGLADPGRVLVVLGALVDEMDRRIAALPLDRDTVATSDALPLVLVVLEEWPGTLRALEDKAGKEARRLTSRLLAESHKAGLRVLVIAQRADAAVIGGGERSNMAGRLSFRVDNADGVRMLHPDADPGTIAEHMAAPPGVALVQMPGSPLVRARAPWIGDYAEFVRRVSQAGASGR